MWSLQPTHVTDERHVHTSITDLSMMSVTTHYKISLNVGVTPSLHTAAGRETLTSVFPQRSLAYFAYFYTPRLLSV